MWILYSILYYFMYFYIIIYYIVSFVWHFIDYSLLVIYDFTKHFFVIAA